MRAIRQFGWSKIIQLPIECIDFPSRTVLIEQQWAINSWACRRKVRESALHELVKVLYPTHHSLKKKRVSEESIHLILEDYLTHQMECLKREVEEQRALIENMKEEAAARTRAHEEAVSEIQKRDQIISELHG